MKNILVTIDVEEEAQIIINAALHLAEKFGSKLWLVHISAPEPDFIGYSVGPQYIRDIRAKEIRKEHKLLQEYSNQTKNKGIESEGLLIKGTTIEMLMEESKKLNIDLIIAGHHEHGFFYSAFTGSTSSKIIRKSKIPVLIVPID